MSWLYFLAFPIVCYALVMLIHKFLDGKVRLNMALLHILMSCIPLVNIVYLILGIVIFGLEFCSRYGDKEVF